MKKFIISAALLAATSSAAFAGQEAAAGAGGYNLSIYAPVASAITATTQTGAAMPTNLNTFSTTGAVGGGNTTSGWISGVTQSAGVVNVISSTLTNGIRY